MMTKNRPALILLFAAALTLGACKKDSDTTIPTSKWIWGVQSYNPAPGQFINTTLGNTSASLSLTGGRGEVSLGGFGGNIIFYFQTPVKNIPGADLCILGNAFAGSSEPGTVVAIVDKNKDRIFTPDEMYLLVGSEYDKSQAVTITYTRPTELTKAADVPWSTSLNETGKITAQPNFHAQSYYPNWITSGNLNFSGLRAPYTPIWNGETWVMPAFTSGYADNYSADYEATVGNDPDTRNSNKFDLDNTIDNQGNRTKLPEAEYIMVYTCVNAEAGAVGEISTEVCGAINLSANL